MFKCYYRLQSLGLQLSYFLDNRLILRLNSQRDQHTLKQLLKMKVFLSLLVAFACLCSAQSAAPNKAHAVSRKATGGRIIGGATAFSGQFPSAAAIYVTTSGGTFFCGGSLIDQQWVLTSATCIDGGVTFRVILGSNTLSGSDPNRLTLATSIYVNHPDFNPFTLENDIGLVKFHLPIIFTEYIQPALLPTQDLINGLRSVAIGWGQTSDEHAGIANELYYVAVTSIPNEECQLSFVNTIFDAMVCVAGNYNEGTCNGDSGSPLMLTLHHLHWTVAVASFISTRGCETSDPSGYTRTYPYVSWIKETINGS